MRKRVPDSKIIEMLENNEDCRTQAEIAVELGIDPTTLSKRLSKIRDQIRDKTIEYAQKKGLDAANHLFQQSRAGRTDATKLLLELSGIYTPKQTHDINTTVSEKLKELDEKAESHVLQITENSTTNIS